MSQMLRVSLVITFLSVYVCSPVCDEAYGSLEVPENTPVGTPLKDVKCKTSDKEGGELRYAIKSGNVHGKFGINSTSSVGTVYVYQAISFESRTVSFQLTIEVTENGPERTAAYYTLDVHITGVNDYAPLFLFSPYTVYIDEDRKPGSVVANPIPYDFDKGADGATTSMILKGDESLFYMDPRTARVYLRNWLDYEAKTDHELIIQVTDDGIPERRSSTTLLNIHVKDVNDNPPVCQELYITETFRENKEGGSVVTLIRCTDVDSGNNGRLTYSITDGDYTKFRLQGPYLVLAKPIDVDTEPDMWTLSVKVRDRGEPRLSAVVNIVIYVEGVDDNGPVWAAPENGKYVIDVEENTPVGSHLLRISADDIDNEAKDAVVMYYIDDYTPRFSIKPTTGDIFLTQDIDREMGALYTLPVSAVSPGNQFDRISTDLVINVLDVNDNAPTFDQDVFHFYVREDAQPRSEIAKVSATDIDDGENAEVVHRFIGGDPDSLFDIHPVSGVIFLIGSLDYETDTTYIIYLQGLDKGRPPRWSTCTVIVSVLPVNEYEPIFKPLESIYIAEDALIGSSLFTVEATDEDTGLDGHVFYSIEQTNEKLLIESRRGVIRLRKELDRETEQAFQVVIYATDMSESISKTGTLVANIFIEDKNDNVPSCEDTFISSQIVPLMRSGDTVLILSCSDNDIASNAKLNYAIIDGNANFDFTVSSKGELILTRTVTSPKYRLEIKVSDNGNPSLDTKVVVLLELGGKPVISDLPDKIYLSEAAPVGTPFYKVKGESLSRQLTYALSAITQADGSNTTLPIFTINRFSGQLYTWRDLDRELMDKYIISVTVTDTVSQLENTGTFQVELIDSNDNVPTFEKLLFNVSIMENIPENSLVLKLSATDLDINENSQIDYDIGLGNEAGVFQIDDQGHLTTRSSIDREIFEKFILVITATDRGTQHQLTGSASVIISVFDKDEYDPEFVNVGSNMQISLSENTPLGAKIIVMKADDLDVSKDVSYYLNDDFTDYFFIDKTNGEVFLISLLDREKHDVHNIVVKAIVNDKMVTATVTLSVLDVNDNAPSFEASVLKFEADESTSVGSIIGQFWVRDFDIGDNAKISVSITVGNFNEQFKIVQSKEGTVLLVLAQLFRYDKFNRYVLTIEAQDFGIPQLTSALSILVEVTPEYTKPKFAIDLEVIHVLENAHIGTVIYDADASLKGVHEEHSRDILYSIIEGNSDNTFSVNKYNGQVHISGYINGNQESHGLLIRAENAFNTAFNDQMNVTIFIDDINDNPPRFTRKLFSFKAPEEAKIGTSLGSVLAKDSDKDENAFVNYGFDVEGGIQPFRIDPFTGMISVKSPLDFINGSRYEFKVVAFDHGTPSLTGTATVAVDVIDINNQVPTFEPSVRRIRVPENTELGKTIDRLKAYDLDTGMGGSVEYMITDGDDYGFFSLGFETGLLQLSKKLDREKIDEYSLLVEGRDKGYPALTGTMTLNIVVDDVNDNRPIFEQNTYYVPLDRFSKAGTHIATLRATDDDIGHNAEIDFRIESNGSSEYFHIDNKYGHLSTFSNVDELGNTIQLVVTAFNYGNPILFSSVLVSIELFPPEKLEDENFVFYVSENAVIGTFVGALNASAASTYSLISGNFNSSFLFTENEGSLFANKPLDREAYPDYYLVIRELSRTNAKQWKDVHVHIVIIDENDNPPVFDKPFYSLSVFRHSPVGYNIGQIFLTDADIGDNGKLRLFIADSDDQAKRLLRIDANNTISVSSPLSFDLVKSLNFTVYARDNGEFSRTSSARVYVSVLDVDKCFDANKSVHSGIIHFEIPVYVAAGYRIGCLDQRTFGLEHFTENVRYLVSSRDSSIKVSPNTGCVFLNNDIHLWERTSVVEWVVASSPANTDAMALLRVDTFVPDDHVIVLTHAVSSEILELNRKLLTEKLERLLSGDVVRIWKIEDTRGVRRRKLLTAESKSYVYVVKDSSTFSINAVHKEKRYWAQSSLLLKFGSPSGMVAETLTLEDFDTFPVISVKPYASSDNIHRSWIRTTAGQIVCGLILALGIVAIFIVVMVHEIKRRKQQGRPGSAMQVLQNGQENTSESRPEASFNLKRSSSSTDIIPLMDALAVFRSMDEKDRNNFIKNAFTSSKSEEDQKRPRSSLGLNAATIHPLDTVSTINEFTQSRMHSNENIGMIRQLPQIDMEDSANVDESSISSLEIHHPLVKVETDKRQYNKSVASKKANSPIIIGGVEYDGVGKDTTTGKHYLYSTQSGDRLHVTDDVFKRAISQRQSVIDMDVHKDSRGAKRSTFKSPSVNRKRSTSRLSTTTIWEMSVSNGQGEIDDLSNTTQSQDMAGAESRAYHNDSTNKSKLARKDVAANKADNLWETDDSSIDSEDKNDVEEQRETKSYARLGGIKPVSPLRIHVSSAEPIESPLESQNEDSSDIDSISDSDASSIEKAVDCNENRDADIDGEEQTSSTDVLPTTYKDEDRWRKVKKVVRFVRPVYKPLSLDNVTCKIPKGKSDPKDCLSKDPFYAGWAKIVGRRMKSKAIRRKDGVEETVTVRQGRSLPALLHQPAPVDVSAYTRSVSNKFPPHQMNRKRLSFDVNSFLVEKQ